MGALGLEPTGASRLASGWEITRVDLPYISQAWPYVEGYVEKGLEHTMREFDPWDVYQELRRGAAQLWLIVDEEKNLHGCVITEILQYPRRTSCRIWITAGEHLVKWNDAIEVIEAWARYRGCDLLCAVARQEWTHQAKKHGYTTVHHAYYKTLVNN